VNTSRTAANDRVSTTRSSPTLARIFGRILLTGAVFAAAGFVLLVLVGLGDRYEKETKALGFTGAYERYLAWQAGFPNDPKAYRAAKGEGMAQRMHIQKTTAFEE